MAEKPEKFPTLLQPPHSGMTEDRILTQWHDLVRNVYAHALVRYLSRVEVEALIPEETSPYVNIEEHGDDFLVRAIQKPEALQVLQTICDADCGAMCAMQEAQLAVDEDG